MNRTVIIVLLSIFVLAGNALAVEKILFHGEETISGYGLNEFAVKGNIQEEVGKIITSICNIRPRSQYFDLRFKIVGSTSKDGEPAKNDELGLLRAQQVKACLADYFPHAFFDVISAGAEKDSREVYVVWKIVQIAEKPPTEVENTPVPVKKFDPSGSVKLLLLFLIMIAGVGLIVSIIKIVEIWFRQLATKPFKINGIWYIYFPEVKNNKFQGLHQLAEGKVFETDDMKLLRKSVISSLKKHPDLVEEELKNKRLKKYKGGQR